MEGSGLLIVSVGFGVEIDTPCTPREYSGAAVSRSTREQPQHAVGVAAGKGRQRQSVWFGGGKSKRSGPGEGGGAKVIPSKHKFGTPLDACARVHSYACDVPQALVELWKAMVATPQGLDAEGIFRLTPDADECTEVERQLTSGTGLLVPVEAGYDPIVLGHLMKSFLRRLPPPGVLGAVPIATLLDCETAEGCSRMLDSMPVHERNVLEWLIRVILEVHSRRGANKMKLKNLTVVFAPNLWLVPLDGLAAGKDPKEELRNVERVENALHMLCTYALRLFKANAPRPPFERHGGSVHAVSGML